MNVTVLFVLHLPSANFQLARVRLITKEMVILVALKMMYYTFNHSEKKVTVPNLYFHRCVRGNQMYYSELSKADTFRIELVGQS